MINPEQLVLGRMGLKKESPEINTCAVIAMYLMSKVHQRLRHPVIVTTDSVPQDGAMIWVANHTSTYDSLDIFEAARITTGRLIRPVVRHTLISPFEDESQKVLDRTGKKQIRNNLLRAIYLPQACLLRGLGVIPVVRGAPDRTFLRKCAAILNHNEMVGIFPQETRREDGLLRNVMSGAAVLSRMYPNIPMMPVGISGPPDEPRTLIIGKSFIRQDLLNEISDKPTTEEVTVAIGNRIAELLPFRVLNDWGTERQKILAAS